MNQTKLDDIHVVEAFIPSPDGPCKGQDERTNIQLARQTGTNKRQKVARCGSLKLCMILSKRRCLAGEGGWAEMCEVGGRKRSRFGGTGVRDAEVRFLEHMRRM